MKEMKVNEGDGCEKIYIKRERKNL